MTTENVKSDATLTPAARRILDVATDLFYAHGIRAVGVDLIAQEANVTKKTIYDRFGSKDALIKAYLDRRDAEWHQLIREQVEQSERSPRERILAMFEIMDMEIRERGCGFINAFAELSEPGHPAREVAQRQKTWTLEYFTELARAAGVDDPDSLGLQLLILHEGAYVAHAMTDETNAAEQAREAARLLVDAALGSAD